ncbi:MAG: ribonuclease HII [Candidatus Omnitrophica bacterium]|nr:ribonuclease HII [Candidatus Omnitrophota bacterium]MBU1997614.1 ribonuclease HII [Candidatus Omnitrophota bacterium]MBU4334814.1 ribonuclease HII [Candidatus Omnitrophota bacterium]
MLDYENEVKADGFSLIIGIDEAGRGPLAGPVVAAAVALKSNNFLSTIRDSKKISSRQRDKAFDEINQNAYVGIGIVPETIIDQINILEATFLAMNNAVKDLEKKLPLSVKEQEGFYEKTCLLIDGNSFKSAVQYAFKTIVKGDSKVLSIACASIIAKVTRDRIMCEYDKEFPAYGFKKHKGYPTVEHKQALREYGPSRIHRRSFRY